MKCIPFWGMAWESNSYLLIHQGQGVLIDAGVDCQTVLDALRQENASLKHILLTHGHFDHNLSVDHLREQTGATLLIHQEDAEMLTDAEKSALFLFLGKRSTLKPCDGTLQNEQTIPFADKTIRVIHTPGHSRGSVCYAIDSMLFSGDTLFAEGYGRCDLYGGIFQKLLASLESLRQMDRALTLYPGHGPSCSLHAAIQSLFDPL